MRSRHGGRYTCPEMHNPQGSKSSILVAWLDMQLLVVWGVGWRGEWQQVPGTVMLTVA